MVFTPGLVKVLLRPRPDYVPKVALNPLRFQQVVLEALSPTEVGSENLSLCPVKIFTILHHPYCCYVYTRYNLFAHSSCTFLLILLFIKSTVYCIAHFILLHILLFIFSYYFYFVPIFIYILFCCVTFFALSIERTWPDLHFTTNYILYNWVCDE